MAKKQKLIKWTSEDERKLERTINQFNARVKKLKSTRKDKRYLPEELSFIGTKRLIKTKAELNRVIKNLSEFKGKEAYKKVKLDSGKEITAWEKKKLERERKTAIRHLTKEMAKIERPYYKMRNARISDTKECFRIC